MKATYLFIILILFMQEAIFTQCVEEKPFSSTVAPLSKRLPHSHFVDQKRGGLRSPPAPLFNEGPRWKVLPEPPPPLQAAKAAAPTASWRSSSPDRDTTAA
ncbi:hypothetical protein AAHA92_28221 [Salvia divinorum]|uniref:Uncharacterized protein n=1 Tax=Salvia divinorum TaxID=28513 RepID=A0ABD1FUE1_SALDI